MLIGDKFFEWRPGIYLFNCPGCNFTHQVATKESKANVTWDFNDDLVNPTVMPSILMHWSQGPKKVEERCHSYIRDGKIQFLNDCTHALAGQTVDLPVWNDQGES